MKPHLSTFLCLFLFSFFGSYSQNLTHTTNQNLILNPSFEQVKPSVTKLHHEMRNFGIIDGWRSLINSPDAFHPEMSKVKFIHKAPRFFNQFGQQTPRTGIAKVGMYIAGGQSKEGIITKLKQRLIPGKYYYFQMYASLAEGVSRACTSSIGAYFSARNPVITPTSKLKLHIASSEDICDTNEWTKICGVYKAKGTESYISIGIFW